MSEPKAVKTQRLAEALRANLRRRKAVGQRAAAAADEQTGDDQTGDDQAVEQTGAGHPDANDKG